MAHFAQIDGNGTVLRVIVAERAFVDSGAVGDPASWVETSYNTKAGVNDKGGDPLRKNFAGPGFTYDKVRDAFIPPKPHASWVLNEETCLWAAPVEKPLDGKMYDWDEESVGWKLSPENA